MIWLLIGYMWLFIHRPFEIWPVLGELHIERVYMLLTIAVWLFSNFRSPISNRVNKYFVCFIMAMVVSWLLSPYQDTGDVTVGNYLKYAVFYCLLITSVRDRRGLHQIIVGYLAVMTALMLHSLREYFLGRSMYGQGFNRLIPVGATYDFNDFAGTLVYSVPFAWILWRHTSRRWIQVWLGAYFGLTIYCVVLTGSRMGFLGLVFASALACMASQRRWRLLPIYPVVFCVAWIILPDAQKQRYLTLLGSDYETSLTTAEGYRTEGFVKSLPLFAERPLFGFGPNSYGKAAGTNKQPHNLYGQLLAELGVTGTIAFAAILWSIFANTSDARRLIQSNCTIGDLFAWHTTIATAAAFLLLIVMAWGFNFLFWHVWLWFAGFQVIALHCLRQQLQHDLGFHLSHESDIGVTEYQYS